MSTTRLARLLHPSWHKERTLAVLKNYTFIGDETGIDDNSKICAVAGLVGGERAWEKFDKRWRKVLEIEDIPYFHAVECERGNENFYGLDVMKRGKIVDRLVQIIMNTTLDIYSYGLVKPHFFAWPEDDRKWFTQGNPEDPYYLVLDHLFVCSSHAADELDKSEKIEYVFEEQNQFRDEAKRIFKGLRIGPDWPNHVRLGDIHFPESTPENLIKYPGMQAADLLAYETYRHLHNKHFKPNLRPEWKNRIALKVMGQKLHKNHNCAYFDEEAFANLSTLRAGWDYERNVAAHDWEYKKKVKK